MGMDEQSNVNARISTRLAPKPLKGFRLYNTWNIGL